MKNVAVTFSLPKSIYELPLTENSPNISGNVQNTPDGNKRILLILLLRILVVNRAVLKTTTLMISL